MSDPVYFYDSSPARGGKPRKTVPPTPTSLAAAQQKLKDQKDAKAAKQEEDEPYVYLPPGSSMREPGEPVGGTVRGLSALCMLLRRLSCTSDLLACVWAHLCVLMGDTWLVALSPRCCSLTAAQVPATSEELLT